MTIEPNGTHPDAPATRVVAVAVMIGLELTVPVGMPDDVIRTQLVKDIALPLNLAQSVRAVTVETTGAAGLSVVSHANIAAAALAAARRGR